MPTRRTLLAGLAAAIAPSPGWSEVGAPAYVAAAKLPAGDFALIGLDAGGAERFRVPLPARGHAAAAHPTRAEAVAFARRPGLFALVIDCADGHVRHRLTAPEGRHFYGHGAFSADGAVLYTTENAYETGEGRIGLWAADGGYRRIGEIASGGIGPHEIIRLPGSDVLAVANGGIRTHPASGREKLNLPTMRPNLAYVTADGTLLERLDLGPELRRNSVRHIAVRPDGLVAVAMQWQGDPADAPPLLGLHQRGSPPRLLSDAPHRQARLEGYAGSVAFSGDGRLVAITAPRGNRIQMFEAGGGTLVADINRPDVCGLASSRGGFFATDGTGGTIALTGPTMRPVRKHDILWDNHLQEIV